MVLTIIQITFLMTIMVFSMLFIKDRAWLKLIIFCGFATVLGSIIFFAPDPALFSGEGAPTSTVTEMVEGEDSSFEEDEAFDNELIANENITNDTNNDFAEETVPAEPINWQPLIWIASGSLALIAIFVIGFLAQYSIKSSSRSRELKKKEKEEEKKRLSRLELSWLQARQRHQEALNTVAKYETDIALAIDYPAMNDIAVTETASMVQSMKAVNDMWNTLERNIYSEAKIYGEQDVLEKYEALVYDFDTKVSLAENNAKQVEWNRLSAAEQKDLKTAKMLLKHASNPANPQETRANYMAKLGEVIKRVNKRHKVDVLPQVTINVIEQEARLLLTDGSENNNDLLSDDSSLLNSINISSSEEYDNTKVI